MQDLKIRVNNEDESKEVQELFFELGFVWHCGGSVIKNTDKKFLHLYNNKLFFGACGSDFLEDDSKEITVPELRDMVVLKRNDVGDATHEFQNKSKVYVSSDDICYSFSRDKWEIFTSGSGNVAIKPIEKSKVEVKQNMKKYLTRNINGDYFVVDHHSGFDIDQLILIPEGAEIALKGSDSSCKIHFWKNGGKYIYRGDWLECSEISHVTVDKFKEVWKDHKVVWQEMPNEISEDDVQIDFNKLKVEWFEKFLNGVKVQYRIGVAVGSETSQWCNMTYNALKDLQHSPIEFREAPKYVVLNGITFKDKESLLRHIANNYNLD